LLSVLSLLGAAQIPRPSRPPTRAQLDGTAKHKFVDRAVGVHTRSETRTGIDRVSGPWNITLVNHRRHEMTRGRPAASKIASELPFKGENLSSMAKEGNDHQVQKRDKHKRFGRRGVPPAASGVGRPKWVCCNRKVRSGCAAKTKYCIRDMGHPQVELPACPKASW